MHHIKTILASKERAQLALMLTKCYFCFHQIPIKRATFATRSVKLVEWLLRVKNVYGWKVGVAFSKISPSSCDVTHNFYLYTLQVGAAEPLYCPIDMCVCVCVCVCVCIYIYLLNVQ